MQVHHRGAPVAASPHQAAPHRPAAARRTDLLLVECSRHATSAGLVDNPMAMHAVLWLLPKAHSDRPAPLAHALLRPWRPLSTRTGRLRCAVWDGRALPSVHAVSVDHPVPRAQATGKGAAPAVAEGLGGVNIKGVEDPKTKGRDGERPRWQALARPASGAEPGGRDRSGCFS